MLRRAAPWRRTRRTRLSDKGRRRAERAAEKSSSPAGEERIWWMRFRRGSKGSCWCCFRAAANHDLKEEATSFWEIKKEVEAEEDDDAREVYGAWSEHGSRIEEMKDLDLRRCLVTCLSGSIMDQWNWNGNVLLLLLLSVSGFHCIPSVCVYVSVCIHTCDFSVLLTSGVKGLWGVSPSVNV